ncbi:hypothetical protein FJK98_31570 [Micromonospora sp. HM134]|uniref:hypothetical protein n=1 Tax=Micromonospora sp. HM134 TaxID=2583243 RepID=UPI0011988947|nr:hypothetical protein [Micromonospora sp. HM134]QDY11127.1 hypothetical protein FJK98_31570 [Micromonospora sp. HM134]
MKTWKRVVATAAVLFTAGSLAATVNPLAAAAVSGTVGASAMAAKAVPSSCPKSPQVGKVCGHTRILLVKYSVRAVCRVQDNYPHNPGAGRKTWTIKPGATIIWRYNVNAHVALISDPARDSKHLFPHWGFVINSECIGKTLEQSGHYWRFEKPKHGAARWVRHDTPPVHAGQSMPHRTLYGRSQSVRSGYWKRVDWTPAGSTVPATQRKMAHNRTLRDLPNGFVIGNAKAGWQVRPTSQHQAGYTRVYVPSLHRWGWVLL